MRRDQAGIQAAAEQNSNGDIGDLMIGDDHGEQLVELLQPFGQRAGFGFWVDVPVSSSILVPRIDVQLQPLSGTQTLDPPPDRIRADHIAIQ